MVNHTQAENLFSAKDVTVSHSLGVTLGNVLAAKFSQRTTERLVVSVLHWLSILRFVVRCEEMWAWFSIILLYTWLRVHMPILRP